MTMAAKPAPVAASMHTVRMPRGSAASAAAVPMARGDARDRSLGGLAALGLAIAAAGAVTGLIRAFL